MSFYFDNAATTFPKPLAVYDFMNLFYRTCGGNAGRGQYKQSAQSSKLISETREGLQKLLQCPNKDVIFTPNATLALNMILQGLFQVEKIRTVWISPFEHNAVTRVLEYYKKNRKIEVNVIPMQTDFVYNFSEIERQFAQKNPDLVILTHASNVCGLITPVEEICSIAKKFNAFTVIDMAQSAALVPLRVGSDNIDFAVFEGHKTLLGPFGIGGFVKRKTVSLEPVLFGGTGIESASQNMPNDSPARYEAGSQNILAAAGLHEAVKWWNENTEEIRNQEKINHQKLYDILKNYDFIKIIGCEDFRKSVGVISTLFEGYSANEIGNVLDEQDVAVRTGLHCAPFAHKTLGTFPAGTVRFSVQYFTGDEDFAGLKNALEFIRENR